MEISQGESDFVEISLQTPRDTIIPPVKLTESNDVPNVEITTESSIFKMYKILVIGEPGVGKSSFIKRYVYDTFSLERKATISLDFVQQTFQWDANTEVRLHFWDVPGQHRLESQQPLFYRDARAMIVMYDAERINTISYARKWKQNVDNCCTLNGQPYKPPAILVCNKIDTVCVNSADFDSYALDLVVREEGFKCGFPISNLRNYNIAQLIRKLVEILLQEDRKLIEMGVLMGDKDEDIVNLDDVIQTTTDKKKCEC